ncbi:MAG: hypothetical protein JO015_16395 [Verrucomicrobia bacterium]|nr:hypothetical protein [Verrucomicrobiota bacterium]
MSEPDKSDPRKSDPDKTDPHGSDPGKKTLGDTLREVLSMQPPSYPTQDEPKHEEKEQMTEPADEFRDLESNKARTTTPEPDVGPRT